MWELFSRVFVILYLLVPVLSISPSRFRRIASLDRVYRPGFFAEEPYLYTGTLADIQCIPSCLKYNCVSFVQNNGKKLCYFYNFPLVISSSESTFTENSAAYVDMRDVVTSTQLVRHFNESKEVWIVSLTNDMTWTEAKDGCSKTGGHLLPIKDSKPYSRFNKIDVDHPGVLRYATRARYWVGMTDFVVEGVWKNVDGSAATGQVWHANQPSNYSDCGVFFIRTNTDFKLGDWRCNMKQRHICSYTVY